MSNKDDFKQNKYVVVRNLLDADLGKFLASYFQRAEGHIEAHFDRDWTSLNAHSDACGDTVMYMLRSAIEANTGLELIPTYSFVRMYRQGDKVGRHKDGKENQVSCTICIERDIDWPLGLSNGVNESSVILNPGDGVIYQGYVLDHWRDKYAGQRQVQIIVGYVVKGGEFESFGFYGRGAPMYYPTAVKRDGPVKLAKGALAKLRDKIIRRQPGL